MALVTGNTKFINQNPGSSAFSTSHTHNVGDDGLLLVVMTMTSTVNFSNCTYGGVSMSLVSNALFSGLSQRQAVYSLSNPLTGGNTFTATFSGSQWSSMSFAILSFTGSSGIGNYLSTGGSSTPHSETLTVSQNSLIYASGISNNSQSFPYTIDGSNATNIFTHNTNKIVEGALPINNLNAGNIIIQTKTDFGNITNLSVEIMELGVTPPTTSPSSNWFLVL